MKTLTIKRKNDFQGYLLGVKIFVDDKKVKSIRNGETEYFEFENPPKKLEAKYFWNYSNVLDISKKNHQRIELKFNQKNSLFSALLFLFYFLGLCIFWFLDSFSGKQIIYYHIGMLILGLVVSFIFFRKNITLKEIITS